MKRILFATCTLLFIGCKNSKEPLDKQLIGEWNNLSMKININSKENTDSNEVFSVERPEWEQRLKIKPIRTFFREDSTFNSAHYNLKDSLIYNPSGKWYVRGDKLFMLQSFPFADTSTFTLIIDQDVATFEGPVDWDEDGKKDDIYFGRQQKVSKLK